MKAEISVNIVIFSYRPNAGLGHAGNTTISSICRKKIVCNEYYPSNTL
jgi:hypothetical protein